MFQYYKHFSKLVSSLEKDMLVHIQKLYNIWCDRSEHERHSPQCPFVKGEFTQNVPMSGWFLHSMFLSVGLCNPFILMLFLI